MNERLLVLVVALSRNIVVLDILLSVEYDLLSLHFPVFDVYFVSN